MLSCGRFMKNFLVVAVTVALGFLFYDALQPAPASPVVRVAAVAPRPTPAPPKLYFHSALDAPPMSPLACSGTSYFSTDSNPGFRTYYTSGAGSTSWNPGLTDVDTSRTGVSSAASDPDSGPLANEVASLPRRQESYLRGMVFSTPLPGRPAR